MNRSAIEESHGILNQFDKCIISVYMFASVK